MTRSGQRGVAMLAAILLVAIATILAAGIGFKNAMSARRGAANLSLEESVLVAEAAEALAAYALREDFKDNPQQDHPNEGWANRLGPIEVPPESGVFLEAAVQDLQGRFNLNRLVRPDGTPDEEMVKAFQELLEKLEIEPKWAQLIADWIDPNIAPEFPDGGEDSLYLAQNPPYRPPNLPITSATELLALPGFGRERYLKLAPYVTALPQDAPLNVCSAPGFVLDAFIEDNHSEYGEDPERLAKNREDGCFPTKDEYRQSFPDPARWALMESQFAERSRYFRLTSIVTIGTTEFALYSLLVREQGGQVRPILRSFAAE